LLPFLACGDGERPVSGSWVAERDTSGDNVVVRTISGSVWGEPATLVEELAIGVLEGPDELMFGAVSAMAVDAEGRVYVFDRQVPALRYFDASGAYVRTLGREGSGPGEYRDACLGLAVRSDGRVLMRDPRNARINVYEPDGTPADHWPVASGLFAPEAMTLDTADHVYLKILTERPQPNKPWKIALQHLDPDGQLLDTIPDPPIAGEPESGGGWRFEPTKHWAWSPLAYMVVGVSRDYSFEVRRPGGPVLRIERVVEPVELHPEERAEWEAANEWRRRTQADVLAAEIPPVAARKPPYRGLFVGERGRIWVWRYTVAEKMDPAEIRPPDPNRPPPVTWREPRVFDVFEPDGTYLGEVHLPPRTRASIFRGDTIWGIRTGELDEQYVVRLEISR
jgi:sugar lactone lactonase YvrE